MAEDKVTFARENKINTKPTGRRNLEFHYLTLVACLPVVPPAGLAPSAMSRERRRSREEDVGDDTQAPEITLLVVSLLPVDGGGGADDPAAA